MCQHTAGQHMSDDDHFSEGQTVTHGSRRSFFAKRTQNLLMCPQNGNLRFLTHDGALGAIMGGNESYGRRASFWMGLNLSKKHRKIKKTQNPLDICDSWSENHKTKIRFSKMSGKHFPNSVTHRGAWAFSNWFMDQN